MTGDPPPSSSVLSRVAAGWVCAGSVTAAFQVGSAGGMRLSFGSGACWRARACGPAGLARPQRRRKESSRCRALVSGRLHSGGGGLSLAFVRIPTVVRTVRSPCWCSRDYPAFSVSSRRISTTSTHHTWEIAYDAWPVPKSQKLCAKLSASHWLMRATTKSPRISTDCVAMCSGLSLQQLYTQMDSAASRLVHQATSPCRSLTLAAVYRPASPSLAQRRTVLGAVRQACRDGGGLAGQVAEELPTTSGPPKRPELVGHVVVLA